MQIIQILIPADGIHIGINAAAGAKAVALERQTFPFGETVHHLHITVHFQHVKLNRALHTVEIVVESRLRPDK